MEALIGSLIVMFGVFGLTLALLYATAELINWLENRRPPKPRPALAPTKQDTRCKCGLSINIPYPGHILQCSCGRRLMGDHPAGRTYHYIASLSPQPTPPGGGKGIDDSHWQIHHEYHCEQCGHQDNIFFGIPKEPPTAAEKRATLTVDEIAALLQPGLRRVANAGFTQAEAISHYLAADLAYQMERPYYLASDAHLDKLKDILLVPPTDPHTPHASIQSHELRCTDLKRTWKPLFDWLQETVPEWKP